MSLNRIIGLVLQYVLLINVNLTHSDIPIETHDAVVLNLPHQNPSQPVQPGNTDCRDLRERKSRDDDNGNAVTVPPDVCGMCPGGKHDLEPCECISMGRKLAGTISINCNASTGWTTVDEMKEMFDSVDEYPSKHVFRFNITGTNMTGQMVDGLLGPLDFKQIIMDNNKLETVDNYAFNNTRETLELLSMKNNGLYYFHWGLDLPNLYSLVLQGNSLRYIPARVFLPSELTYLDLSRNEIDYIGDNAFYKLHNLRKLDLSYNKLEVLSNNMFSIGNHNPRDGINDLQIILSNNNIKEISHTAFVDVQPVVIDLRNNSLTTLEPEPFMPIIDVNHHMLYVELEGNPIVCDCDMEWMDWAGPLFSNFECYFTNGSSTHITFDDLPQNYFDECGIPDIDEIIEFYDNE